MLSFVALSKLVPSYVSSSVAGSLTIFRNNKVMSRTRYVDALVETTWTTGDLRDLRKSGGVREPYFLVYSGFNEGIMTNKLGYTPREFVVKAGIPCRNELTERLLNFVQTRFLP